jgi:peptide/nickel transport system substrate-binding protein
MKSHWKQFTAMLTAVLLFAAGCGAGSGPTQSGSGNQASQGVKSGGKIVYGAWQDPDTLDPQRTGLAATGRVIAQVFDTLTAMKAGDSKIYPGLAESWEVSPDGRIYTFKLRKGVKFHDGTPLNAEAVKFTFDRIINPDTKSLSAKGAVGPYEGSEVIDEHTVKLKFSEPYPPFLTLASGATLGIISPTAANEGYVEFARKPIGSGPFMIKEFVPKSHITLVKNPDYNWAPPIFQHTGPAFLDEIVWKIIPEVGTRMATLDTGETQVIEYLVPEDVKRYQQDKRFQVLLIETPGAPRMNNLNTQKFPLDDVKVRQAINFATNRQEIVDTLFKGVYDVAYGPMEKATFGYDASLDKMYPFDENKAKQLLEEAGWKVGANNIRTKDGKLLELHFVVAANDQWDEVAQMWQAQLLEVGIDMKLSSESQPAVFATYNKGVQHVGQFFFWSPDPVMLYAMFHSKNIPAGFNWSHYSNPEVDQWIEQSMKESDRSAREALVTKINQKVMEDAAIVSIHTKKTVMALDAKLEGLGFSFVTYPLFYELRYK